MPRNPYIDENNPYLQADIQNIIDAYTTPGKGTEILEQIQGAPAGLIPTGVKSGYAMLAENLQQNLDEAKGAVGSLYGYGTFARGENAETGEIAGVEFSNTFLTIGRSGDFWEGAATALVDCIPCKDRVLALLSFNPLNELMNALDQMYELQFSFLINIWDLLLGDKSVRSFADICSLLQFLNFMCVQDLVAMILVFKQLITKYTWTLKDIKVTVADLLAKMFGASLAPLLTLLDRYIQLIVGPIECVIESIDAQLQRLDVLEGVQLAFQGDETTDTEGWFDRIDTEDISKKTQSFVALITFRKYLKEAVDYVDEKMEKLQDDVHDLLGTKDKASKEIFDVTLHIERITNFIGLLQALILAISQGALVCQAQNGEEELEAFVNTYLAPSMDVDIIARDGIIEVAPSVPDDLDGMKELLDIIGTYKKTEDQADKPTTRSPTELIGGTTIPITNCLYTVEDNELDKVKEFLSTFE